MSTGRIGFNKQFHDLLRARKTPMNMAMLAKRAGCGRASLSQVLNGRRSGRDTWKLLFKCLTAEEYDCAFKHAQKAKAQLLA